MSAMADWLAGVTILDLSQYIPGPLASLMLAGMGPGSSRWSPPAATRCRRWGRGTGRAGRSSTTR